MQKTFKGINAKPYIKAKLLPDGPSFIDTFENMKGCVVSEQLLDMEDGEGFEFTVIYLSEKVFDALDEFEGF